MMRVGTAGWANPSDEKVNREPGLTHLQRYAQLFNSVEINSSFYRLHRRETYERWAASTGSDFRFSVKIPKAISHDAALRCSSVILDEFVEGVRGLGSKLAVLLLQLAPQAECEPRVARRFFRELKSRIEVPIVCEPRHPSWASSSVERLFREFQISWVSADPVRVLHAHAPIGDIQYYRLHGSPRVYWSSYADADLRDLSERMTSERRRVAQEWCIFDNTAAGAAWLNARLLNTYLCVAANRARRATGTQRFVVS